MPITVEIAVAESAKITVFLTASSVFRSLNSSSYHLNEKLENTERLFASLKEKTSKMAIGAKRKMKIIIWHKTNYISELSNILLKSNSPITYGVSSLLLGNLLNNIPMSILFSEIFTGATVATNSVYAVIAASNLCALLTPIGSLAGMMFISLVKQHKVNFTFIKFMKYGLIDIILVAFTLGLIVLF